MRNKCSWYVLMLSLFASLSIFKTYAQGDHFIYIQSDAKQTFNAAVNNKNYVSSDIGYLIIPGLTDGNCNVAIRFPEDSTIQLNFPLTIDGKDEGFQLKNFGAKGWGLFNLQTMDVTFSGLLSSSTDQTKTAAKSKAFGDMLSDVVNDSTLNKPVTKPAAVNSPIVAAAGTSQPVTDHTSAAANNTIPPSQPVVNNASVATNTNPQPSQTLSATDAELQNASPSGSKGIIKSLQESGNTGTKLIFIDFAGEKSDTVNIFIPAVETSSSSNNAVNASQNTVSTIDAEAPSIPKSNSTNTNPVADNSAVNNEEKKNANPFYSPGNNIGTANSSNNITTPSPQSATVNCTKTAEENDLYKLRKKMIAETDANDMIQIAKKQLKGKCVSTEQVKGIGGLFLSDEARYNFYEAMYKFTYDPANYISLQSQLIDDYYRKRFQALVH
jgi:hypothetical protein